MKTLLIPCAGKSSRFPNMRPKWLLTHPDGQLMIQKALSGLDCSCFDRIIITVVKEHCDKYEADLILHQVFENYPKVEICILDDFTKSVADTIHLTINKMSIEGTLVIKDSDNKVQIGSIKEKTNFVVGYDLIEHPNISNIPGKSFLVINSQNLITDIIEKQIVSNIISLGIYGFENVNDFERGYFELSNSHIKGELYVSHIISYLLCKEKKIFEYVEADGYEDWGTFVEWKKVQDNFKTIFIDVDGVLLRNHGKYGRMNWSNTIEPIEENLLILKKLQDNGAQIVITTSRSEEHRESLIRTLNSYGIKPYSILMGLNHAPRYVINDFAPSNPFPSAIAISIPRNSIFSNYLDLHQ